jgi:hypothetical protein
MGMSMCKKFLLGTFLTISLLPFTARAHWCNDIWSSSYNIVVRPASDTITVPSSGSASLDVFVQNNMGYPLPSFTLTAQIGTTKITATRATQKVASTLLPGEKAKYTLAVTKSGGGSVGIGDISFLVSFGSSGQSNMYGTSPGKAVIIRTSIDGSLIPAPPPPGIGTGSSQARTLQYSALADFSDVSTGLDKLVSYYCAGRGTWDSGTSDSVITAACTGSATECTKATATTGTGAGTDYQYAHLWSALQLAVRKSSLGDTRLATLRQRLQCGAADPNTCFGGFTMMMLGYLGDDPGARTFLAGKVGTSDLGTIAKAALLLFGTASDKSTYEADVKAGLSKGGFVGASCAAALGIVEKDDASVTSTLVPMAKWTEPATDNGQGLYASHLLSLVAWDRRVWAAKAADTGAVSFYGEDTTTPTGGSSGTGGSVGSGGNTGAAGAAGTGGVAATGGKTGTASGGSAGTPTAGAVASGGVVTTGGKTGTASGGSAGTPTAGAVASGGVVATGGKTGTASGGNSGTPTGGSVAAGGSSGTPSGGTPPAGGSRNTGSGAGGSTEAGTGGSMGPGAGGEGGNGGPSSGGTASGSASGCGYAPFGRAPIPLGFLLAGVGLALAARRRRH